MRKRNNRNLFSRLMAALMAIALSAGVISVRADVTHQDDEGMIFGSSQEYSTYETGTILNDSFYYTDEWFKGDAWDTGKQNDALALVSMQLIAANVNDTINGYTGNNCKTVEMLTKMGFDIARRTSDYTWGRKELDNGTTLIAVIVNNYSFDYSVKEEGWKQNFNVNGEEGVPSEHCALSDEAKYLGNAVATYADGASDARYWIMGQSRGGAIANLACSYLDAALKSKGFHFSQILCYTFEAPATVETDYASAYTSGMIYVHNYVCSDDIVTKLPMWGMVRHGTDHQLKTTETDSKMQDELVRLMSAMKDVEYSSYDGLDTLISSLETRVSAVHGSEGLDRADYSKVLADVVTTPSGTVTVSASAQSALIDLMGVIFGKELSGLSLELLGEQGDNLVALVNALVNAVKAEQSGDPAQAEAMKTSYWMAATGLRSFLLTLSERTELSLSNDDFYVLLRLLGPLFVDTTFVPDDEGAPIVNAIGYLLPVLELYEAAGSITYSHHFDSVIARLKVLAPQPTFSAITVDLEEPGAGDIVATIISDLENEIEGFDLSWFTLKEASIDTTDETLKENKKYYLDVTFEALAHLPDESGVTVKVYGKDPVDDPEITYENGATIVKVTFLLGGDAAQKKVSFNPDRNTEAPAALTVDCGESLRFISRPQFVEKVTQDGVTWVFDDWYDDNTGRRWDDVVVDDDMTLTAHWLRELDSVSVDVVIPALGNDFNAPTVPEGSLYSIVDYGYIDGHWNETTRLEEPGFYELAVIVTVDETKAVFAKETDEYGDEEYAGKVFVNGEEVYGSFIYADDGTLALVIYYDFNIPGPDDAVYTFAEGDGQSWDIDSDKDMEFRITCNYNDAGIIDLFEGIEIDGQEVDPQYYITFAGSVRLRIYYEYLEELDKGEHKLTAKFSDGGTATAKFFVKGASSDDPDAPFTGDAMYLWTALALVSLAGCVIIRRREEDL